MKNRSFIKNKLKLALLAPAVCFSLMLTSCDKEVTELAPYDRLTEESAFTTPERVELAVAGVYDAAQSGFYAGGAVRGYPFGAAHVEQGDNRGEDMLNLEAFYAITYGSTYNAASANNVYHFETLYAVINKANIVIEGVEKAVADGLITAEVGNAYIGEARFLRALSHHELLVHFARPYNHTPDASHLGVPYRTLPVNTPARVEEAAQQGRDSVRDGYAKLLEDLNYAEANLPETRSKQISRATKGAAIALKTRVKLHMRDWAGVIEEGNKLVPASGPFESAVGGYELTASPDEPFANNGANSESVFSFENSANDNASVNGSLGQMYNVAGGRGLVSISPIIWNAEFWPEDDARRDITKSTARAIYTYKYRDAQTQSDWSPIMRYAEVLLNVAEAEARAGDSARALELLNAVRGRSTDEVYADLAGDALIQAIVNERRIEFLGEGLRWKDIHRLAKEGKYGPAGIPAKVASANLKRDDFVAASGSVRDAAIAIPFIPYDDFRFIWPLPISEINANPVLAAQQNPGY
ncbi:RagB/SusD family nutrient uptake outer membrane protein [Pontibacter anaerobius]|uniref:RagB/SusD family nutrient uptake outer membrane protein n=1 Tax=Pontibacter anaerobius TaxID=2993940 RepID=A0ABT3RA76_9BACT|nr:RagB/SusD family nutrient uptake outer membrane protein [Pontibacter anaerobius]MCX2738758.1 RagB/SusD family nutrient uptake outer membrane protein [Pontibacter anaerobius]